MTPAAKLPARRMGPRDSESSTQLLDAAERVMRNEGYGAVSSRRVAEEAGLKQQLVYYYFQSMDDLLLACFKRRTARALARLEQDAAGPQPVRAIWNTMSNASDGNLSFEFMALANHHPGIGEEVTRFIAASRQIESAAITRQMAARARQHQPVDPAAGAFLLATVALMLRREEATGITDGHAQVRALIEQTLASLD